jgi:chemotaxis protein methyltransferase CheR
MMNAALQEPTFRQIRDFIYDQCGIYVPDAKKYLLEKKLAQRLEETGRDCFEAYLSRLRADAGGELEKLFDAVTTNETYFFREPNQLAVFTDAVVPQIFDQKRSRTLRLWSAACSTGEEPYTLAMLIAEKTACTRADVFASDISGAVLETARKGEYGSYSMRNLPGPFREKYFKGNGWAHEISDTVKNAVRFMNINLMDEKKVRVMAAMDVIFCRNVLIYFDDKAKQKAVSLLYDCLRPGGFLFIGSSESLHNVTRAFMPVTFGKVLVYQKA